MKTFSFILALSLFGCFISSCEGGASNELTNPETIKGMRLGLDYEAQRQIGRDNGMCGKQKFRRVCEYELNESIYAQPSVKYSYYKGKKVLGQVDVVFDSPGNFLYSVDEYGNVVNKTPRITGYEVNQLVDMYKGKYGEPVFFKEWDTQVTHRWEKGDLSIELKVMDAQYAYARPYLEDDSYYAITTYTYIKKKRKLLQYGSSVDSNDKI